MKDNKVENEVKPPGTVDDMVRAQKGGEWIIILRQFFEALRSAWPKQKNDNR
ncbi:hypothetical protein G6K91_22180 [Agrobacterium rhizogenes]|nr:hypothetical protein [Rhizobium rhizogenes]NTG56180.1 hypothetical protein [Rhizobium rhizogenes]NTH01852.1 hypothetical protein [Rhizobium rhizogenes]NTI57563.1 hypothetical protein [Rhizobium rhizogenes]